MSEVSFAPAPEFVPVEPTHEFLELNISELGVLPLGNPYDLIEPQDGVLGGTMNGEEDQAPSGQGDDDPTKDSPKPTKRIPAHVLPPPPDDDDDKKNKNNKKK